MLVSMSLVPRTQTDTRVVPLIDVSIEESAVRREGEGGEGEGGERGVGERVFVCVRERGGAGRGVGRGQTNRQTDRQTQVERQRQTGNRRDTER